MSPTWLSLPLMYCISHSYSHIPILRTLQTSLSAIFQELETAVVAQALDHEVGSWHKVPELASDSTFYREAFLLSNAFFLSLFRLSYHTTGVSHMPSNASFGFGTNSGCSLLCKLLYIGYCMLLLGRGIRLVKSSQREEGST